MISADIEKSFHELQLASEEPLAAYVYDLPGLAEHARRLVAALPANVKLFYAIKANAELPLLQTLAPLVGGFEAASGGELDLLREHFPQVPILFGGPGKTPGELRIALQGPIQALHVESLWELEQLGQLASQTVPILLRVNPVLKHQDDSPMLMAGKPSPFGLDPEDLPEARQLLEKYPLLDCLGYHFHTRSLQLDAEDHLRLLRGYFELASQGPRPRMLNLGGGIGVNYRQPDQQFPWENFCSGLRDLIEEFHMQDCDLRFECGRFVSGFCGYYGVEVLDLKRSHGEWFAVCRGGTHQFRLPVAQGHSHPFQELASCCRRGPEISDIALNVVGQLCTPKDRLATQTYVPRIRIGDILVFPLAGAYAWNISHHDFLMHPHPRIVFLS